MILVRAKEHHIRTLVANLREEDRKELDLCLQGSGLDRLDAVMEMWSESLTCEAILTDDGVLAGVWGVNVCPGVDDTGAIWMLGTPMLPSVSLAFLRECSRAIARAHEHFTYLACTAWRENSLHLAWLEWCGFIAHDIGQPFIGFAHVRPNCDPAGNAGRDSRIGGRAEPATEQVD